MGYQLDVVAESVAEALQQAGGLMCDRSLAGWTVAVRTDDVSHPQALMILGAEIRAIEQPAATTCWCEQDRQTVVAQADRPPEETASNVRLQPVTHRLSAAARAFKAHALRAAGIDSGVETSETLWASEHQDPDLAMRFARDLPSPSSPAPAGEPSRDLTCLAADNLVGECPGG